MTEEEAKTILSNAMSLIDIEEGFYGFDRYHEECLGADEKCSSCQHMWDTRMKLGQARTILNITFSSDYASAVVEAIMLACDDLCSIREGKCDE